MDQDIKRSKERQRISEYTPRSHDHVQTARKVGMNSPVILLSELYIEIINSLLKYTTEIQLICSPRKSKLVVEEEIYRELKHLDVRTPIS